VERNLIALHDMQRNVLVEHMQKGDIPLEGDHALGINENKNCLMLVIYIDLTRIVFNAPYSCAKSFDRGIRTIVQAIVI
jgi:hypothetical protein